MLNTIIIVLCAVPAGAIVFVHLAVYLGLVIAAIRERRLTRGSLPSAKAIAPASGASQRGLPSATVVVPARDEAHLLPRLLDSLERQTTHEFDIVLVNDRSKDETGELMEKFRKRYPARVTVIHLEKVEDIGNGKLYALIQGTRLVKNDIVLFTDADCAAPETWIEHTLRRYADTTVGLLIGPIETRRTGRALSTFHSFDHIFKYAYTAGCTGIDIPTGGFGNNLSVRRAVLEEIGGLESVNVTVTEDAALIARVRELTSWKIRALFDRKVTIFTEPQPGWRALNGQEIRWHTGGIYSPDFQTRLNYRFIMFYLTISVLAIPFIPLLPPLAILTGVSFVTMALTALVSGILTSQPFAGFWAPLLPLIIFEMVYDSYLTIRAVSGPELTWKGDRLKRGGTG